jgi:hypothetical protein
MSNVQIPNLPAVAALSGAELFEGVQAGTSVKISLDQVIAAARGGTPATLPIPVSLGGTGVATITGYVKGSGTSPFTGSATIPNTDITGLGTMSTQDASAVAITGGSITGITNFASNNVTITGGSITGITDLAVADGGTGVSTLTGYVKGNGTTAFTASATVPSTDITGLGTMSTQDANSVAITGGSITGITDLAVADGGTGASTLTGYVKGSGTTALTASATIPNTDITGLGTMSVQNDNSVTITGGSINGTAIGASSASTIAGTTGTFSGNLTIADKIVHDGDTNTSIRFPTADTVTVETAGTERMRIDSAGNVGIGTSSPAAQLHVEGNTTAVATITTASITGTTLTVVTVVADTIAVGDRVYGVGVAPITRIVSQLTGTPGGAGTYTVSVSQTVGSGTMYTSSGAAATVRITDTDTTVLAGQPSGTIEFFVSDINTPTAGVGAYISAVSEDASPDTSLTFGTRDATGGGVDANEAMRITSAGRVGIGTASPAEQLHITGNFRVGSAVLATPTGSAPIYACRAWVHFDGTGTPAIRASGNVTSITDNGTGDYTVNFTTAMPDADYSVVGTTRSNGVVMISGSPLAGSVSINTKVSSTLALTDFIHICLAVFR